MMTTRFSKKTPILVVIVLLFSVFARSADYFWVNGSGNWNDPNHWSLTSGGSPSGTIPGSQDNVIFDDLSFTSDFPAVQITSHVDVKEFKILCSSKYPGFYSDDKNLTIHRDFLIENRAHFSFTGSAALIFENNGTTERKINTNGVALNANIIVRGYWALNQHLIATSHKSIQVQNGTFITNGYTVHSKSTLFNQSTVNTDFTGSTISGVEELDISMAHKIGGEAIFNLSGQVLANKGEYPNSDFTPKTTVICPSGSGLELELIVTSNYSGSDISCKDSCDGELTITVTGTAGPYSYSFENGPFTTETVYDSLCHGTYTITVVDSSNEIIPGVFDQCSVSESVVEPGILVFPPPAIVDPTCPDVCDGQAFSFPSGGTNPLTVCWNSGTECTNNPVGLCTGWNDVLLTDANGCFILDSVFISDPPPIIAAPVITPSTCNGDCDAEILVNPSGGNGGPHTVSWNPVPLNSAQGSNPGIGFCAGPVTLSVFDIDGCQMDTVINIIDPPVLSVTANFVADALCNGSCDGQSSATPNGGTGGYTFEWFTSPGNVLVSTNQNPNTLCAGNYYVVVTDASGCTDTSNIITIGEPIAINSVVDAYDVSCFGVCDGAVDVDASGGTPGYTYSWETFPGLVGISANDTVSGLCPGQYQVTVTDANGCTDGPILVEVFEPAPLNIATTGTDPTCYDLCDGSATTVVGGGTPIYSYSWVPLPPIGGNTANPSGMCADTYDLTVTDANGCQITDQVTISNPPQYDITTSQTNLLCFGDSNGDATVTVNSGGSGVGYTYNWAPNPPAGQGSPTASGLSVGNWCVTIQDDQLCDTTICFTITSPPQLTANASVIAQASCFGDCNGSAQVVVNGGTNPVGILWTPTGQTTQVASGLCAGNYTVDITDANGCTANDAVTITEPAPFDLTTSQVDLTCFNDCIGSATVTMNSGGTPTYVYQWDDPLGQITPTATNLCAGNYTCTVTDQNLCDTIVPFTIVEPPEIVIDTNWINSTCFGTCTGAAWLDVTGGTGAYTFEWFDVATGLPYGVDNDTITSLCPGDVYASVTDANGCTILSDTMTILELPEIITSVVSVTDATCGVCDGAAEVLAVGGTGNFSYDWTPDPGAGDGNASVTGLCAGVYNVLAEDDAGCSELISVTVNSIALENLSMDSVNVSCFGLCDGQAIVSYTVLDPPYTVEWFDYNTGLPLGIIDNPAGNPSSATGLCAGTYTAVVTNNSGCVSTDTVSVFEPPEITATLTPTNVTCNGDCNGSIAAVANGGTGVLTYSWNPLPGSGQGTPNAGNLCAGNWTLTVTDAMGCSENFVSTISEPVLLVINNETSTDITCFGANDGTATVTPAGGIPPVTYEWFDCNTGLPIGQNTQQAINLGPGDYQCVVTDANGCTVTSGCLPVNEPNPLDATINTSTVNCYGFCDGIIDVIPSGGSSPYFYQWEDEFNNPLPGQTNDTLNNVCQGIYNVTVTDFNGCSITFGPIDMTAPSSPWVVNTTQTNVTCAGSCDGTAGVTVLAGNNPPYTYLWDDIPGSTTPNVANLCPGTYNVVISDAGICDTTVTFNIIDNTPIIANATITNVACFGDCTGEIYVEPFGGVPPYTVTWSDLQVGDTAFNLCMGAIMCTITDGNGCTKDTTINITEPPELTFTSSIANNATCNVCNGSATINVAGGVPGYTYVWTPDPAGCCGGTGQGTNNAQGLCSGVYTVDVTDANGCVLTEVFNISDVNAEAITMVSNDASCFGACDGDAEAQYVCNDPACTNQWYDGATGLAIPAETNATISGLCAGDYFIEVINNSGCVAVELVTISSPSQIDDNEVITPVSCNGSTDGSIVVTPSGGSGAGYTYSWNPVPPNGDGTNSALNIGAGTWDLTITDGTGCSEPYSYNLINPTPIVITPTVTDASCFGNCDGSILVNVAGGWGGYSYQWYQGGVPIAGETSPLITNLCAGFYDIEVIDAGGCSVFLNNIPISEPIPISGPISGTDVLCNGACDGTATVVPGGGFPPYVVNWYDAATGALIGQNGTTAIGLCPGDYYAVITDNNGCNFTSNTITITEPPALTFTLNTTPESCFSFCDGTADMIMAGGTPPYTYIWLDILGNPIPGGGGSSIANLCAGNYTIEVLDDNGCTTGQQPFVINGFPEITGNTSSNDATCGVADGTATVFPNGGNPPFTYQWMDDLMVPIPGETNQTILNVTAGTYFVEVMDANGCTQVFQADVSNVPSTTLTWDNINHPSCAGTSDGSIEITATGVNPPLSYSWNPGGIVAEDPSGLTAGNWTVTITDAMGCINIYDTTLVDPSPIVITSSSTPSDCGQCNGTASVNVSGGTGAINVIWNNSLTGTNIIGLCSGVYEAQVTDANGCQELEQVSVNNTGGLTATVIPTSVTCAGDCDGAITVNGNGGTPPYSYFWLHDNSTSNTINGLCAGTYYCEVSDAVGCTWTEEITLPDPNPIQAVPTIQNPNCLASDGSISVLTSGGSLPHSYQWNTGSMTPAIGNLSSGTYTLTVTDAVGCQVDFVYGLSDLNAAAIVLNISNVNCYNACDAQIDTLSLTGGTPAFSFQWLDDTGAPIAGEVNPLITGLCDGTYMLEVTDAMGCLSYQPANVTQPDTILLNPLFVIDPTCNGVCDGELISNPIGGTLPFTFSWDDPGNQSTLNAINLCDGTYTVTITDVNACQVQQTGTVSEPPAIVIVQDSITDATCLNSTDGEIYVTVSGGTPGYTYEWISQTAVDTFTVEDITNLLPMDYYLTVTDANGCITQDTASVDTILVVLTDAGLDSLLCFGNGITLIGSSNVEPLADFTWYDTTGAVMIDTNEFILPPAQSGTVEYILEVFYAGCTTTDTISITTTDSLWVEAGPDIEMYPTQSEMIGGSPTSDIANTLMWTPSIWLDDSTIANPLVVEPVYSTMYYVTATDTNGCAVTDSVFVEVLPEIIIPNGISPDGNGLNETWILEFLEQYPGVDVVIQVYNRWGELLFESDENYADDWGGTTQDGKRLPAGTYYYIIDIDHEDFPEPFTGPITIMW